MDYNIIDVTHYPRQVVLIARKKYTNPTRALLEMRSTIALLNTLYSGQGQSLTLVSHSSLFPNNH